MPMAPGKHITPGGLRVHSTIWKKKSYSAAIELSIVLVVFVLPLKSERTIDSRQK